MIPSLVKRPIIPGNFYKKVIYSCILYLFYFYLLYWILELLITSSDVLHSWAIPSFGVKMDACAGRLNQVALYITRSGVFYGQCSELCGVNHAFMPIVVEAINI